MVTLKNGFITAQIKTQGAELSNLVLNATQTEFIWSANPDFWGKSSPILFPIVGELKDGFYIYDGKKYKLPRHGFARNSEFSVIESSTDSVTFSLKSTDETLKEFPFRFELRIKNWLEKNRFYNQYQVINLDSKTIYFSIGGHPAFAVPNVDGLKYDDYTLEFDNNETLVSHSITTKGLQSGEKNLIETTDNKLSITKELFKNDALILKDLKSKIVTLKSSKTPNKLTFNFEEFKYLGLWAAPNADFVCIEPWAGICDTEIHNHDFTQKEGIQKLEINQTFEASWWVEINA